ncbi:MAG: hypothetical protein ABSB15_11795 [Bryobacteraceae bacterium]
MRKSFLLLAAAGLCIAADTPATFTGIVGDDMCRGDHKTMGGTDAAKCTAECIKSMKAKYALWVGKDVYVLSDQTTPAKFAGKKVTITGTVTLPTGKDADKILLVKSIAPAK